LNAQLGQEVEDLLQQYRAAIKKYKAEIQRMEETRSQYALGVEFQVLLQQWVETERKVKLLEADIARLQ
jgi:hypothetical protein